jgi:hypothetical protein
MTTNRPDPTQQHIDRLVREVMLAEERGDAESAAFWMRCLTAAVRESEERS